MGQHGQRGTRRVVVQGRCLVIRRPGRNHVGLPRARRGAPTPARTGPSSGMPSATWSRMPTAGSSLISAPACRRRTKSTRSPSGPHPNRVSSTWTATRACSRTRTPCCAAHRKGHQVQLPGATRTEANLRASAETLDFTRPIAVLLFGILHFFSEDDDPAGVVRQLRRDYPRGAGRGGRRAVRRPGEHRVRSRAAAAVAPGPGRPGTGAAADVVRGRP